MREKRFQSRLKLLGTIATLHAEKGLDALNGHEAEHSQKRRFFSILDGLGLAAVHKIITIHGDHITIDSMVDEGTLFTLMLPAIITVSQTDQLKGLHMTAQRDKNNTPFRVLLMDDEAIIRDITSAMLEDSGHTVVTTKDGATAIDSYQSALSKNQRFDAVIMDLTIPGGQGGKGAIDQLLAIDPEAKVIVSSGYSSDPILADYQRYGFAGKLTKPFKLEELEQELNRVMDE